jgi:hypothetical protein
MQPTKDSFAIPRSLCYAAQASAVDQQFVQSSECEKTATLGGRRDWKKRLAILHQIKKP